MQGAGAVWGALVQQPPPAGGAAGPPQPWSSARLRDQLIPRVEAVAPVLAAAEANLRTPVAAFVNLTLGTLDGLAAQFAASIAAVAASATASGGADPALLTRLQRAGAAASAALTRCVEHAQRPTGVDI